jgi:predicted DNA-binding transcriptional regulator YafY
MEGGKTKILGFYNQGEEDFITNYLLAYTNKILSINPSNLKVLLQDKISLLGQHFSSIN